MVCLFYSNTSNPTSTKRSLTFRLLSIFLLLTSSLSMPYVTTGRSIPQPQGPTKEETMVGAELIGSRPPRCEGRCIGCSHCEAVQVPIAPQTKFRSFFHEILSRGDDTNYKPLNWKCKCGNVIVNP